MAKGCNRGRGLGDGKAGAERHPSGNKGPSGKGRAVAGSHTVRVRPPGNSADGPGPTGATGSGVPIWQNEHCGGSEATGCRHVAGPCFKDVECRE